MLIITDPGEFQNICWSWRCRGLSSALVPTMGYLHQGHLSLFKWARDNHQKVAASIFVNPTQFGPNEDLDRYPRDTEGDTAKAREAGVDVLFMPEPGAMYPEGACTSVSVSGLTAGLCGASRPSHFGGVATVVAKLLLLAMPTAAAFGQKDWQQLAMIRRMVKDLNIPVAIEGRPIYREADGLAMSSRNVYLSAADRAAAPHIQKGLQEAKRWHAEGLTDGAELTARLLAYYKEHLPSARPDYVSLVHPETIAPLAEATGPALLAVALFFPGARLIDNMPLG